MRSVDDHEIGVGPVTLELQKAYLDTVRGELGALGPLARPRRGRRARRRRERDRRGTDPALGAVPRRAGGGARARGAALGPALARADDRPLRGALRRGGRARRTRPPSRSGTAGLHLLCRDRRRRAGRRGDHVAVLVRRVGQLLHLRGRDARLRGRRPSGRSTSTRPPSRPRSRRGRRRSSRWTSSATRASSTRCARCARSTASPSSRTPARRSAPSTAAAASAPTAVARSSPSTRTSRSRRARAAW